jgi:putative ABC transport system permease protein
MLVSVTERTREIGLRKAVGARPRDILLQFLFEAVILSALGGMIGVLIGYLGSLAISSFLKTAVPIWAVLLGVGFSSVVGVVFGVAPAIRASRLQPIEALRHE